MFIGFNYTDNQGNTGKRTLRCRGRQVETATGKLIQLGVIVDVTYRDEPVDTSRMNDEVYVASLRNRKDF